MAYCSDSVSRKLRIISFLGTVSVVVIHTNYLTTSTDCLIAKLIGDIISYLQIWAVPLFFVISGFFMEREFRDRDLWLYFKAFLAKKSRSIIIPYLLWGICYGLVVMTLLKMGVAVQRGENDIWGGTIFAQWGQWAFFDSLFGITHAPLIGALWYLRVLILVTITFPLWIGLFRYAKWVGLGLASVFILASPLGMHEEVFALPFGIVFRLKINAVGWVLMGMAASSLSLDRFAIRKYSFSWVALLLWIVAALLPLYCDYCGFAIPLPVELFHRIHPLFTIIALWGAGDWLSRKLPEKLPEAMSMGFWIYCMHHPITGYVGALGHIVFGRGMASRLVMQLIGWIITLAICISAGLVFKKSFPKTYKILCGGR